MPADRFLHPRAGHSTKVTLLTDLEYRVWTQYLLSADDFGVMRALPIAFQNDNDHLANRPQKVLQRCIDVLVKSGLAWAFEHQGKPFLYQPDWQKWQKVEYPRATNNPIPEDLSACEDSTRALFAKHPGGLRKDRRRSEDVPNVSQAFPEGEPTTRAGARETAKANGSGQRLTANGSEGGLGETSPPLDRWLAEFTERYPAQARCANHLTERAFFDLISSDLRGATVAYAELCQRLDGHKRSHQWRVKNMIPRLDRYLREGLHLQELPEHPVAVLVNDKTAGTLEAAAAAKRFGR